MPGMHMRFLEVKRPFVGWALWCPLCEELVNWHPKRWDNVPLMYRRVMEHLDDFHPEIDDATLMNYFRHENPVDVEARAMEGVKWLP